LGAFRDPYAHTCTSEELVEVFIILSSDERVALDLGPVHVFDTGSTLMVKALQYKVSLEFIKLADFLAWIQFDCNGVAIRTNIVQAF
jgi:hypothetical protein